MRYNRQGCRHVGSSIGGKNIANPTSMIFSGVLLLRHLGHEDHANRIANAVYKVISQGKVSHSCFLVAYRY